MMEVDNNPQKSATIVVRTRKIARTNVARNEKLPAALFSTPGIPSRPLF
jgi:hypothetical protein